MPNVIIDEDGIFEIEDLDLCDGTSAETLVNGGLDGDKEDFRAVDNDSNDAMDIDEGSIAEVDSNLPAIPICQPPKLECTACLLEFGGPGVLQFAGCNRAFQVPRDSTDTHSPGVREAKAISTLSMDILMEQQTNPVMDTSSYRNSTISSTPLAVKRSSLREWSVPLTYNLTSNVATERDKSVKAYRVSLLDLRISPLKIHISYIMIALLDDSGLVISVVAMLFGAVVGYTSSRKLLRHNVPLVDDSSVSHPTTSISCKLNEGKLSKEDSDCTLAETDAIMSDKDKDTCDETDTRLDLQAEKRTTDLDANDEQQDVSITDVTTTDIMLKNESTNTDNMKEDVLTNALTDHLHEIEKQDQFTTDKDALSISSVSTENSTTFSKDSTTANEKDTTEKFQPHRELSNLPAPITKVFDIIDHTWETAVDFTAWSIVTFAIEPTVLLKKNCENVIDEVTTPVVELSDKWIEKVWTEFDKKDLGDMVAEEPACGCFDFVEGEGDAGRCWDYCL
ncbi:hypothetical protein HDU76_003148 [Blyttiomyces sp. JEL0837]|nr:hypothetical protein HDU76_003148 [Blyttiomyces sp. JEL0837]